MIHIRQADLDHILEHAARSHPEECCGLLIGSENHIAVIAGSKNLSDDPERAFEIDPALHLQLQRQARMNGETVVGVYHSHPNGVAEPSAADRDQALEPGWIWLIIARGECRAFRFDGQAFAVEELIVD